MSGSRAFPSQGFLRLRIGRSPSLQAFGVGCCLFRRSPNLSVYTRARSPASAPRKSPDTPSVPATTCLGGERVPRAAPCARPAWRSLGAGQRNEGPRSRGIRTQAQPPESGAWDEHGTRDCVGRAPSTPGPTEGASGGRGHARTGTGSHQQPGGGPARCRGAPRGSAVALHSAPLSHTSGYRSNRRNFPSRPESG